MTHADLVERSKRWLLKTIGCGFVLAELSTAAGETPDAIGWKYGWSYLVECKAFRSDFLSDKRKMWRRCPEFGLGNSRYYMCEPGVITVADLPDNWGLLYAQKGRVRIVRKAVRNPDPQIAVNDRVMLCSALRRVHLRGDLEKIYGHSQNVQKYGE